MSKLVEHIFGFVFSAGGSAGLAIYVFIAIKERRVYWRNFIDDPWVDRDVRPITFWLAISLYSFLSGAFALLCISGMMS
ncbi:hypothetical protein [Sphingobium sp. JAI105]|nr:hypothetical protein [Sphingobium sp. JAI105]